MPRRRGWGEGTIRRRVDGLYEGRLAAGSENGRRKQFYVYAKSYRQAQVKLAEKRRARDEGLHRGTQTVREFLALWLEEVAKPRVRPRVYIDYEGIVRNHLVPSLGRLTLQQLARNPEAIQRLLNAKRAELSPGRVAQIRVILHGAMKQAVLWRRVPWNPVDAVGAPQPVPRSKQAFDAREALRMLHSVKADRLYPLYVLAVTAGLRQSELFALRWTALDLEAGWVRVEAGLHRAGGKTWLAEPKTRRSRRAVPLTDLAVEALRVHPRTGRKPWADLVFTTTTGTPLHGKNLVQRSYYPTLERAGLPRIPFRNLRHACGSLLLALGVDLPTIGAILGHARFSTTADRYLLVSETALRDAADRLQRALTTTVLPPYER